MAQLEPKYPILRPNREGFGWYLDEDTVVHVDGEPEFTIPKGYIFDGHSVPRPLWMFFPPFGRDIYAALAHDYAYEFAKTLGISSNRKFADRIYRSLMHSDAYGMGFWRATIMVGAVKMFGWLMFYSGQK